MTIRIGSGQNMPTPFENPQPNLKRFELRREPIRHEARARFLADFNHEGSSELRTAVKARISRAAQSATD